MVGAEPEFSQAQGLAVGCMPSSYSPFLHERMVVSTTERWRQDGLDWRYFCYPAPQSTEPRVTVVCLDIGAGSTLLGGSGCGVEFSPALQWEWTWDHEGGLQ